MLSQNEIEIFSVVSFEVYPQQLLGDGFNNVKIMGLIDAETAMRWIDPVAMHAAVYPSLPTGAINAYDQYLYVKLLLNNGQTSVIGLPWIKKHSYQLVTGTTMQVTVENVNPSDEPRLRAALASNGFNQFKIIYI